MRADPLPLEQTDPGLAEHFRLIVNRQHPTVHRVQVQPRGITVYTSDSIRFKPTERNALCPCGSGKRYKKCHYLCPCGSGKEFADCCGS